jgi:DNA repair protein RecN (Recombination protein N)
MLLELSVENLLLIERGRAASWPRPERDHRRDRRRQDAAGARARPAARRAARAGIVRPGAAEAYVEGVFELPAVDLPRASIWRPTPQELVLARRVGADGRTRAYLCGRSIPVGELRELAGELLSFYGQHEHRG